MARDRYHRFSKEPCEALTLVAGIGVLGDAHAGTLVQHRSRQRREPNQENLRQVHLIHTELFAELAGQGYDVSAGDLGENITTTGVPLLDLPVDTRLRLGPVVVRLTGLRNPCRQIEDFRPGLLQHVVGREGGRTVRRAGVMAVVEVGGEVHPGQEVEVEVPGEPHQPLEPV